MPFTKGHRLSIGNKGGGRKGYEYEQEELQRMRRLFKKGLTLLEKMVENKETLKEAIAYGNVEKAILKIMDKFHANKQEIDLSGSGELPFTIKIVRDNGTTSTEPRKDS